MTAKRFTITQDFEEHHRQIRDNGHIIMGCFLEPQAEVIVELLNKLSEENERLKSENSNLHQKLFEQRTRNALERTEISKQPYKTSKEFLKDLEKW